jgi:ABC-type tungstate transport system permease subunit
MVGHRRSFAIGLVALIALDALSTQAQERYITVASTTSTEQSGLFSHLLPRFEQGRGIKVHVVAVGTGQALDLARRGDADVVFVHARSAEEKFLAEGHGVKRFPVMYNRSGENRWQQGDSRGTKESGNGKGSVRVAWRQERHAFGGARSVEGGWR